MAKKTGLEIEGTVAQSLPNAMFWVDLGPLKDPTKPTNIRKITKHQQISIKSLKNEVKLRAPDELRSLLHSSENGARTRV